MQKNNVRCRWSYVYDSAGAIFSKPILNVKKSIRPFNSFMHFEGYNNFFVWKKNI